MKFYDRKKELAILEKTRQTAFSTASQMTVLTGRRRIGKTRLILKSCELTPTVYLFVSRNAEAALCSGFSEVIRESLGIFVPDGITTFRDIFRLCMEAGKQKPFNLVIDEFQEFFYINASVYSEVQDIWDRTKDSSHVNLILSGSVYTLMHRIFQDYREPLYGRAATIIKLKPFPVSTLKQILSDYFPGYDNDSLLAFYAFTGGVPKYIELLADRKAFTPEVIINEMIQESSVFIEEGNVMLMQEFGKKYGVYYSILSAIASGINEPSQISEVTGQRSLGGSLQRLEEDYDVIVKKRPVLSKPSSQNVRYEINDHFLHFWFRYIVRYQNLVQTGKYEQLRDIVKRDYPDYSGHELEKYFMDKIVETEDVEQVGSWWESSRGKKPADTDQHEIDIVAVYFGGKKVLITECKRQRKNFKPEKFRQKVELLRTRLFANSEITTKCLTLEDM